MSKIGKLPIVIPEKTEIKLSNSSIVVKGVEGELSWDIPQHISVIQKDDQLLITRNADTPEVKSLHGLVRSKIANMIMGVNQSYKKILEISGVGFKAEVKDDTLVLNIGFSHPVILRIIPNIKIQVVKNEIVVAGIDKEAVGEMAARIRATKKPEPYKGKGIKYKDEIVRRKAGKAAKTAAK